jgi:hypothetical protein
MIDTLWLTINRSAPVTSTPARNATRMAERIPKSRKATTIASEVNVVRTLRRPRFFHTRYRNFMRPAPG